MFPVPSFLWSGDCSRSGRLVRFLLAIWGRAGSSCVDVVLSTLVWVRGVGRLTVTADGDLGS